MTHRHNTLTDDVFKNSKYIDMLQRHFNIDDYRKQEYKREKEGKTNNYKILLDIFQTFILVNNCFYSDSNSALHDKANKARDEIEKLIYIDYENSQKHKYSVRDIKGLLDKRARKLYYYMESWLKDLRTITTKNALSSLELKNIIEIIEKEMNELEKVGFDDIVIKDFEYQAKWLNYYKKYSIVINKFDNIYKEFEEFTKEYKKKYFDNTGINLSNEELDSISSLFRIITCANNGIVKIINNEIIPEYNINERSSAKHLYKNYLKSLHINFKDIETFEENSLIFRNCLYLICEEVNKKSRFAFQEVLECFDIFYFMIEMKLLIENDMLTCEYQDINKIMSDLKEVYNIIDSIKEIDKTKANTDIMINDYYIPAYKIVKSIIERYKSCFVEVS